MNFIEDIFQRLKQTPDRPVMREVRDGRLITVSASDLLELIAQARRFVRQSGLKPGDRCGLLAPNGILWVALDLALLAEGIVVVPLYPRQAPEEQANMLKDCGAAMVCCIGAELRDGLAGHLQGEALSWKLFDEIFAATPEAGLEADPIEREEKELAAIIYTSGTSGEPKGVMLTVGNVTFMLGCVGRRLDQLMAGETGPEQVFHYLPLCFAGSWILLLACLSRQSLLTLSTDLNKLGEELKIAEPQYFLNVPVLLERIRGGVERQISEKPALIRKIYQNGKASWLRRYEGKAAGFDGLWFALAKGLIYSSIRKKIGANLKALICGSAPLARETQLFFLMLEIPVLQGYGLTETTALCTLDDPQDFKPGRVGPAIPGVEMRLGEGNEILVRGPNIFAGYWGKPEATARTMDGDWLRTGDQGELDERGRWAISGRIKNLIILNSGHNIAPEPIEEKVLLNLAGAQQCVVIGNGRSFLTALITGDVLAEEVEQVLEAINRQLPHYKRIHAFQLLPEPLTIESGLLTANGKLRREAIAARFQTEIDELYHAKKI